MFFIIETQVDESGTGSSIVLTKETRNEAESEFHRILQYAAISSVPIHGAVILDESCYPIQHSAYYHNQEPPEDVPEETSELPE